VAPSSRSTADDSGCASTPDPIAYSQPDQRFPGPAYDYIRATDELPTYEEMTRDPLCKVKVFLPGSRFTYYIAAVTDYDGTPVVTGVIVSPAGPAFDGSLGDTNLEEVATTPGPGLGLPLERDLHFEPMRVSEIRAELAAGRVP
jgi:hypothetical protein